MSVGNNTGVGSWGPLLCHEVGYPLLLHHLPVAFPASRPSPQFFAVWEMQYPGISVGLAHLLRDSQGHLSHSNPPIAITSPDLIFLRAFIPLRDFLCLSPVSPHRGGGLSVGTASETGTWEVPTSEGGGKEDRRRKGKGKERKASACDPNRCDGFSLL